ncbi:MAG: ArsA family ATPase, partial [Thermodesulfobacteriota bacterium]
KVKLRQPVLSSDRIVDLSPDFLNNDKLKFILFGGKGGVGKTSSAASTAVSLAKNRPEEKVLIFSTDPAHSLSDSFDWSIGDNITPIGGFDNLWALELDYKKMHESFMEKHGFDLSEMAERATFFGIKQLAHTYGISYPTSFDFMAILKLITLLKSREFDRIIIDTAPTGHTIRLLQFLYEFIDQIAAMKDSQERHRYMLTRYYGKYKEDKTDMFLSDLKKDIRFLGKVFRGIRTEFVPVTIAEDMSIYETKRLIRALRKNKIFTTKCIIVNGLTFSAECGFCASREREDMRHLKDIRQTFPELKVIEVPMFRHEIRGKRLFEYANALTGRPKQMENISLKTVNKPATESQRLERVKMSPLLEKKLKLVFFGGKGGVGKTTSAAATAVHMATIRPDQKVLIFSTDPAHSLSDSLDCPIGDKVTAIKGVRNLYALEIDPDERFDEFRKEYEQKIREAFKPEISSQGMMGMSIQSATERPYDEEALASLASLAPIGVDELMALAETIERYKKDYGLIIIDTAPTGHLIGVLQRPEMILKWFTNIIQGIKFYSGVARSTYEITRVLLDARRKILNTYKAIESHEKTEFVAVSIAEAMGVNETERLLSDINKLKVSSKYTILNKVVPPSECSFCMPKRDEHLRYIKDVREKFPAYEVVEVPLFPHEIRGVESLSDFARVLYGNGKVQREAKSHVS